MVVRTLGVILIEAYQLLSAYAQMGHQTLDHLANPPSYRPPS